MDGVADKRATHARKMAALERRVAATEGVGAILAKLSRAEMKASPYYAVWRATAAEERLLCEKIEDEGRQLL